MLCNSSDLVDIIQSKEKIMFRWTAILLKIVRPAIERHATTATHVEVPPMEEVIVDAYVDRHENQEGEEERRLLVEMHKNLPEGMFVSCLL